MLSEWQPRNPDQTALELAQDAFGEINIGDQFEYGQYWVERYDEYDFGDTPVYAPCGRQAEAMCFVAKGTDGTYGDADIIVCFTDLHQKVFVQDYSNLDDLDDLDGWPVSDEDDWSTGPNI